MGKNVKNGKTLVYEFWAYDPATDIARETLDELGIPYNVETRRKLRDPSAPKSCRCDDWASIRVSGDELVKWVESKIEERITCA